MNTKSIFVEPFVDKGLGNSAYLVGSEETRTAVLIDPLRDVDRYRAAAERLGVRIAYVLDTHLHADFVSGARELAAQLDVPIGASAEAGLGFEHRPLAEGDQLFLGDPEAGPERVPTLRVLKTPGHTPEHIAFLLAEPGARDPQALFSGGALIVGGAARTDLISHELTVPLARDLYHTLHHKLLSLPDAVDVYPTHGAGSFCVAPTTSDRTTTIGRERQHNPLAQSQSEEEFVRRALSGLPSYPTYYREMRPLNQRGPAVLGGVPVLAPLAPEQVRGHLEQGALILDVRPQEQFAEAHIPGAYGIPVDAPLITWAGWLIPFGAALVLVARSEVERQKAVRQLIRIGYDNLLGYLEGGPDSWAAAGNPLAHLHKIQVAELRERMRGGEPITVLDVRQKSEWEAGHIPGAVHIENGRLPGEPLPLPKDGPIAVHCAHGARAQAGISVLRRRGFRNLIQVEGGFGAWEESGFEVERD